MLVTFDPNEGCFRQNGKNASLQSFLNVITQQYPIRLLSLLIGDPKKKVEIQNKEDFSYQSESMNVPTAL